MPLVNANGVQFHTQTLGEGPRVFMLHGLLTGSLATWYFTAAHRLAQSHRVHLYDLRGHGRSERVTSGYDTATMVKDLDALVCLEPSEPIDLVGHSYGALIALHFALLHPERVRRLALVELPLPPSRIGEMETFLKRSPDEMAEALPPALKSLVGLSSPGRRAQRFLENLFFLTQRTSLLDDLKAEGDVADHRLTSLQCPVLGLFGRRSTCISVGERLQKNIASYSQDVLDGGHYLHLDAGDAITHRLEEFLGG